MKLIFSSIMLLFAAALGERAVASEKQSDKSVPREYLHRMTLSDGSWLVINTPFPANEKRKETLPVRVHLYPKDVHYEKQIDKCLWVAENVTSMKYVPGVDRSYALAKETEDRIFIFFTWNAEHCTIDKRTGQILNKDEGDEALKQYDSVVPLKLLIWRRATGRLAEPADVTDGLPF